jgi:hypothetical protein
VKRAPLVALLVIVVVVAGSVAYAAYYLSTQPSGVLSWSLVQGTARYDPTTGDTNVTITVRNTGTIALKMASHAQYYPTGFTPLPGTLEHTFYAADGSLLEGGGGGPPDTTGGGEVVISYLIAGAQPGQTLAIPLSFSMNGMTVTHPTTVFVE